MHAPTRRAAARGGILLATASGCALVAAACFPSYEFPGDVDDEGGVIAHTDGGGGGSLDAMTTSSRDAASDATDATVIGFDASTSVDATTDGPPGSGFSEGGMPDSGVDSGLLADLVLLLHLDETSFSGSGAVKDSSGHGNNASLGGDVTGTVPTEQGQFNGAAMFKGTGWIEVPSSTSLTLTNKFTLAAWVNYSMLLTNNVSPGIIVKRVGFASASYTLFIWNINGATQAYADEENGARLNSTTQVLMGAWYHLAAVYDGTVPNLTVYVNGVMSGQTSTGVTTSLAPDTTPVRIGDLPDGGNTLTNGKIDEVGIWSRALSAAEIMSLARATGPL